MHNATFIGLTNVECKPQSLAQKEEEKALQHQSFYVNPVKAITISIIASFLKASKAEGHNLHIFRADISFFFRQKLTDKLHVCV